MSMDRRSFVKMSAALPAAAVTASLTLKEEGKPPIEGLDVSVLRLQPSDTLVISAPGNISADVANRLRQMVEASLDCRAIILGDGLKVEGVLRQ